MNLEYKIYKCLSSLLGRKWLLKYYRKCGMKIGKETNIFSNIVTSEPYLISIGEHCTIATDVSLLTHDASIGAVTDRNKFSDLCGRITIGNNCFIGHGAIIMYGVSIPNNTIVAAGSVVVKSIDESGIIVGGNPAKKIGTVADYLEKYQEKAFRLHGHDLKERKRIIQEQSEKLVAK